LVSGGWWWLAERDGETVRETVTACGRLGFLVNKDGEWAGTSVSGGLKSEN
jgi:hypothetical protein